jgi:hypothetical protein
MFIRKLFSAYVLILNILFTSEAFTQEYVVQDSLQNLSISHFKVRPEMHYSIGSSFMYIPHYGSVSGLNASAFYTYPLTPKLTVEGGFLAGRYYSALKAFNPENKVYNAFNNLSVYGTAAYQLSQRLTVYGTGIKQLSGFMPMYNMPSGSFTVGSTLNFGNFSVGASIQMSKWNNYNSLSPFGGNHGYFPTVPW